jgi:hypothetical protein
MAGREKRKRRRKARGGAGPQPAPAPPAAVAAGEPRKSKDDIARERLEPLKPGERPLAVTIAALIAAALGVTTVVLFAFGVDTGDTQFNAFSTVLYAGVMLAMAWGMWNSRYWAVLGFQALLALLIVVWSLLLLKAESVLSVLVALVVISLGGTLFWFLVKSLARIQMPERRPPDPNL